MKYLRHSHYKAFQLSDRTTLFAKGEFESHGASAKVWQAEIGQMLAADTQKSTKSLADQCPPVLLKTNTLKYFSQKVRARFGIQRHGRYEWATAELDTALRMQGKPYIPEVYAYGWQLNRLGLPEQTFSVTENLFEAISLEDYVQQYPENTEPALKLAFDTFLMAIKDGLLHLDPWAGNFLLAPDLSRCWLIDLEFSKLNSPASLEQQLGFAFGFFYRRKFERHLPRTDYLGFIERWIAVSAPETNRDGFEKELDFYLDNHIKRKQRFAAF